MDSPSRRTLAEVGEDLLVSSVTARYGPPGPGVVVGPGDDAAVLDLAVLGGGRLVVSTDTLVEGRDFRRDWSTPADVGVKLAAQNFADVAAMGARPVALLVSLAAPGELEQVWARGLADGLADECARAGADVVGGDVSAASEVVLTATALGLLTAAPVRRSGARPGDVVALAGATGPSAAGLALLAAGQGDGHGDGEAHAAVLTAHRAPRPDYAAGPAAAAGGATALIDTSDGLLRDAARLAASSGVVVDLDPGSPGLAAGPALAAAAAALGDPGLAASWVYGGGEDHCLLACFPPGVRLPAAFVPVGSVRAPGPGQSPAALVGGEPWRGPAGWVHFG
jgi:thiamine-monophosphate kinase